MVGENDGNIVGAVKQNRNDIERAFSLMQRRPYQCRPDLKRHRLYGTRLRYNEDYQAIELQHHQRKRGLLQQRLFGFQIVWWLSQGTAPSLIQFLEKGDTIAVHEEQRDQKREGCPERLCPMILLQLDTDMSKRMERPTESYRLLVKRH